MKAYFRMIRNLIRRVSVSMSLPDTDKYPMTQITYLGKTANMEILFPYGMGAWVPKDAIGLCFNVEGMEENKMGILNVPTLRFKLDAEGETSFGNPLTGSVTYYRANGDIEVIGKNNQTITIDKEWNITVGEVASITAPIINLIGDVNITGNLTATGTGVFTGALSGEGIDVKTHKHKQGNDSDGDTQVDTDEPL